MTTHGISDARVAIIGAGPAGLVTARWLIAAGITPVIFEAASRLGGQWNSAGPHSATWPAMRTNTSRVMTAFSDLDHSPGTPVYPRQDQMLTYLERYSTKFALTQHIRLGTAVVKLDRSGVGWTIRADRGGVETTDTFAKVIIGSGRHSLPVLPELPGLATFSGVLGAAHSASYTGPRRFAGASVLVAGCSISALEIAADLAGGGAASVGVAMRRQRYVLPKLIAGVPTDHVMFNRAAALVGEILPPEAQAANLKAAILRAAGNPVQYGAAAPDDNIFAAGISQSHGFLPAVAEGRITPFPWIERIEGKCIHMADGRQVEVDALLFGTGFRPAMPWLAPHLAEIIGTDAPSPALFAHTFHPELDGLAFVGLYDLVGPYLPVLELQARWIAQVLSGHSNLPSSAEQMAAIEGRRAAPSALPMHALAVQFARLTGAEPDPARWPHLERALLFGPLSPASFRLDGPDATPDAPHRAAEAASAFGRITTPAYEPDERSIRDIVLGPLTVAA